MFELIFITKKNKVVDVFIANDWNEVYSISEQYVHPDGISEVVIRKK